MLSLPSAKFAIAKLQHLLPNVLVLGTLGSIGLWGHLNHWHIPKFSELGKRNHNGAATATIHETKLATSVKAGEPELKLKSPDTYRKLGIETASAEQRTLDEYVSAKGVITYDQTHLARLSPRAPGIVWRVEKHLGQLVQKGEVLAIIDSSEVGNAKAEFLQALVAADHKAETLARLKSDVSRIWILIEVRKEDAGRLAIGQQVLFSTVGLQDEVESKVTLINERLSTVEIPPGIDRPEMGPVSTGLGEVVHYMLEAGQTEPLDLTELRTTQDWEVKPALRPVAGTAEVNSWGCLKKQYQVRIDPARLTHGPA